MAKKAADAAATAADAAANAAEVSATAAAALAYRRESGFDAPLPIAQARSNVQKLIMTQCPPLRKQPSQRQSQSRSQRHHRECAAAFTAAFTPLDQRVPPPFPHVHYRRRTPPPSHPLPRAALPLYTISALHPPPFYTIGS